MNSSISSTTRFSRASQAHPEAFTANERSRDASSLKSCAPCAGIPSQGVQQEWDIAEFGGERVILGTSVGVANA